jgi:hypothetical protein
LELTHKNKKKKRKKTCAMFVYIRLDQQNVK